MKLTKMTKRCVLFYFYIKPQRLVNQSVSINRCVLFYFYIKPQQAEAIQFAIEVVTYSISTSNHNALTIS